MRNFDFYSPTYFVFGKDREAETGRYVKRFGGSRVLVVYGGQSAKRSGLLDRIMACLKEENLYAVELGGVKPNPRSGLVYEGIDLCRREKIDFILAVGGGSVIDTAKAIAIGVPYDGDFWDFFSGKVPEQALPVGTVLTIAASGSEGSPDSIITNEKTLEKNGAEADCLRPCFSVLDPALTESLPAYQTACGITDIMAHTFERYFTNTPDVEVTDRMLEGVLLAMLHEGRRVMEDPHNYEARANIMWAGMVCHNDIMGVGRQQDWNSHHLEHVLSAKYDCAHGAGLAVIMPAWMRYCAEHGGEKRLAQMAVRVFGCQMDFDDPKRTALEGIEAFRAFLRSIGMPLTFAEIGADPADIPELGGLNQIGDAQAGAEIYTYDPEKLNSASMPGVQEDIQSFERLTTTLEIDQQGYPSSFTEDGSVVTAAGEVMDFSVRIDISDINDVYDVQNPVGEIYKKGEKPAENSESSGNSESSESSEN